MANTTAMEIAAVGLPEFADLVGTNQAMVFSIACHFLHDRVVAEEIAHDVFLQLYPNLPSLESEAHVTAHESHCKDQK